MNTESELHSGLLVKNVALNFLGALAPLVAGLLATPFIIRSMGVERFGLLSLAWTVLWYSAYFDLGLTRATTKFAAEALGKGEETNISSLVYASLGIQTLLGVLAALALTLATPLLLNRVLHVSGTLAQEAKIAFYLMAASIPFFLNSNILSSLLAAAQRFDLVNAVKIISNSMVFLLPVLGLLLGWTLPGICLLLFVSRVVILVAHLVICVGVFPQLKTNGIADRSNIVSLLRFGGWVTISNILAPLIIYLDRFVVGSVSSLAAVTYYSVPYEIVSRLQFIPGSMAAVLYPAFSIVFTENRDRLARLYARSLKSTLLVIGPVALLLAVFGRDILRFWLGSEFSRHSSLALQILSIGLLLNALGYMPGNLLDGVGRPDLRAKIYLGYFLPYLLLLWFLVQKRGIEGAALAWSIRAGVELLVYLAVTAKLLRFSPRAHLQNGLLKAACACCGLGSLLLLLKVLLGAGILRQGIFSGLAIVFFVIVIWHFVLDSADRHSLYSAIGYTGQNRSIG